MAILVLGVVGTGLAFVLQYDVVREVGPTVGATVTYVIPVVAVVLGMVFLHERLQWPQVAGAAIVLASAVADRPRTSPTGRAPRGEGPGGAHLAHVDRDASPLTGCPVSCRGSCR